MPTLLDLPIASDAADLLHGVGSCHQSQDEMTAGRECPPTVSQPEAEGQMRHDATGASWDGMACCVLPPERPAASKQEALTFHDASTVSCHTAALRVEATTIIPPSVPSPLLACLTAAAAMRARTGDPALRWRHVLLPSCQPRSLHLYAAGIEAPLHAAAYE